MSAAAITARKARADGDLAYGQLRKLVEILRRADEKDELLMVSGGLISTPGCSGDYGCCSEYADLSDLYELVDDA